MDGSPFHLLRRAPPRDIRKHMKVTDAKRSGERSDEPNCEREDEYSYIRKKTEMKTKTHTSRVRVRVHIYIRAL